MNNIIYLAGILGIENNLDLMEKVKSIWQGNQYSSRIKIKFKMTGFGNFRKMFVISNKILNRLYTYLSYKMLESVYNT